MERKIVEKLNDTILQILNKNKTIIENDFILQVYPSDEPFPQNVIISDMDFNECESILRESYSIPYNEKLILAKIDYTQINSE